MLERRAVLLEEQPQPERRRPHVVRVVREQEQIHAPGPREPVDHRRREEVEQVQVRPREHRVEQDRVARIEQPCIALCASAAPGSIQSEASRSKTRTSASASRRSAAAAAPPRGSRRARSTAPRAAPRDRRAAGRAPRACSPRRAARHEAGPGSGPCLRAKPERRLRPRPERIVGSPFTTDERLPSSRSGGAGRGGGYVTPAGGANQMSSTVAARHRQLARSCTDTNAAVEGPGSSSRRRMGGFEQRVARNSSVAPDLARIKIHPQLRVIAPVFSPRTLDTRILGFSEGRTTRSAKGRGCQRRFASLPRRIAPGGGHPT